MRVNKPLSEDPSDKELRALWNRCVDFIRDNSITCPETINQCDWIIEDAYSLMGDIADIVGYIEEDEDDVS
jgi:hypothetical protein